MRRYMQGRQQFVDFSYRSAIGNFREKVTVMCNTQWIVIVQIVIQGDNTSAMKCDFQTNCGAVSPWIFREILFWLIHRQSDSNLYKDDYAEEEEEVIGRHGFFFLICFFFVFILSLFPLLNHIFSETATPPHSSNIKSRKWFLFLFLIISYRLSGRN